MPRFWAGVNLGVTIPGHHPSELAPTREDYDAPLYVIQGVWIPEEEFLAARNAYAPEVVEGFDAEIADAVAVVHGDAELPERPGHASGRYTTDVARWLLAWSPGVEWDPEATKETDVRNRDAPLPPGWYIAASEEATPMHATGRWPGGFFASYHAYPYFPDFLRLQYRDAPDPYAAHLRQLRAHHGDQAVMITEFGVPTGIGAAHRGPLGRDQGDLRAGGGRDERRHARWTSVPWRERRKAGWSTLACAFGGG